MAVAEAVEKWSPRQPSPHVQTSAQKTHNKRRTACITKPGFSVRAAASTRALLAYDETVKQPHQKQQQQQQQ